MRETFVGELDFTAKPEFSPLIDVWGSYVDEVVAGKSLLDAVRELRHKAETICSEHYPIEDPTEWVHKTFDAYRSIDATTQRLQPEDFSG